jgi:hypothetical protein
MIGLDRSRAIPARRNYPSVLAALAGFSASVVSPLPAQFSVTPVVLEIDASDSAVVSRVRVRNEGARELAMRVYARDFDQDSIGEHEIALPGSHPNGCGDRIRFVPTAFSLEPDEDQTIAIELSPGPGDSTCWSLVFIDSPPPADQKGIRVGARIGVKVFGLPAGGTRLAAVEAAEIAESQGGRLLKMQLANDGIWPILARGTVEIMDFDGEIVGTARIERTTVLPSRKRLLEIPLESELPPGRYLAVPLLHLGDDALIGAQVAFRVERG